VLIGDATLKIVERALCRMVTKMVLVEGTKDRQPDKKNGNRSHDCQQPRPGAGHHVRELYNV